MISKPDRYQSTPIKLSGFPAWGALGDRQKSKTRLRRSKITLLIAVFFILAAGSANSGLAGNRGEVPLVGYKGIVLLGSPDLAARSGEAAPDLNQAYLQKTVRALKIIETHAPGMFKEISATFMNYGGHVTFRNFPNKKGVILGKFRAITKKGRKFFIIELSTRLFSLPGLFNAFNIASTLIHEAHGHARGYYANAPLNEAQAFASQMQFARLVGDEKFQDVRHRFDNLKFRVRMTLSNTGNYVKNKRKKLISFYAP